MQKLAAADIAFARVNDPELLGKHPHLRRIIGRHAERAGEHSGAGAATRRRAAPLRPGPALGAHTDMVRKEFGFGVVPGAAQHAVMHCRPGTAKSRAR